MILAGIGGRGGKGKAVVTRNKERMSNKQSLLNFTVFIYITIM